MSIDFYLWMWILLTFEDARLNDNFEHSLIANAAYVRIVVVYFAGCHWSQGQCKKETWPYLVLTNINNF